jgi:hypothetical protein
MLLMLSLFRHAVFRRRAIFAAAFITPLRYFIFSAMIAAIISSLRRYFRLFRRRLLMPFRHFAAFGFFAIISLLFHY